MKMLTKMESGESRLTTIAFEPSSISDSRATMAESSFGKMCIPQRLNMGHDRIRSSFWMTTLLICCAASTTPVVSSFQPEHAAASTQFHPFVKSRNVFSSHEFLTCDVARKKQYSLQYAIEECTTEAGRSIINNPLLEDLNVDDEQLGFKYLSSKEKYGNKTMDEAYQRQKQKWADRYTSVEALRETFGTNRNKLWGDLEAGTARRLYKTLLPRALLELSRVGAMQPEDLAPLAYQARVAAKLYTRERCTVPARLAATLYDGFRQWKTYGKFQAHGLTYEQLWEKYAKAILDEANHGSGGETPACENDQLELECVIGFEDDAVNEKVCQKILERACKTNDMVDNLVLNKNECAEECDQKELLEKIHTQLQRDVYELLLPLKSKDNKPLTETVAESLANASSVRQFRALRLMVRARQRFMSKQQKERRMERRQRKRQLQEATVTIHNYDYVGPWGNRENKRSNRSQRWVQRSQTWSQLRHND